MKIKISSTKSASGNNKESSFFEKVTKVHFFLNFKFKYRREYQKKMANYCFIVPTSSGGIELMRKWNQENIINNKEHDAVFKAAGISREQAWVQHLPQGDFILSIMRQMTLNIQLSY